jgi:hypothetical protein
MVIKPREVNGWKRIGEQAKCGGELNDIKGIFGGRRTIIALRVLSNRKRPGGK